MENGCGNVLPTGQKNKDIKQDNNTNNLINNSMKRTVFVFVFAFALALFAAASAWAQTIWDGSVSRDFAGGSGTKEDPYRITNGAQLAKLAQNVNNGNSYDRTYFVLNADIVLNDISNWESWNESTTGLNTWTPIGSNANRFTGTLDGDGHSVSGIYISSKESYQGLVGVLGEEGTIQNINVTASYIKGHSRVGGICGNNSGNIFKCTNSGNIHGINAIGGICGVGNAICCYNSGTISGDPDYSDVIGGIAGAGNTISNCANSGRIQNGYSMTGGICGVNWGTITNCYNIGSINGLYGSSGSICGASSHNIINCYWLQGTAQNGIGDGSGGTAINVESVTMDRFASGEIAWLLQGKQEEHIWGQNITFEPTDKFPVLNGMKVVQTNGSYMNELSVEDDMYTISCANELRLFASMVNSGQNTIKGKLTANIALNDTTDWKSWNNSTPINSWIPIGSGDNPFIGTLDGQGHTISGIYINNSNEYYQGFVAYLGAGGIIQNLGITASYIKGHSYVGGICGINDGSLINSFNASDINGTSHVGGICGYNNRGTIYNCYYLDTRGETGSETAKTAEQFANGEVTYLLQSSQEEQVWGQIIGTDSYPIRQTMDNKVYKLTLQNGKETDTLYANSYKFTLPIPHQEGYTFVGWFNAQTGGEQALDNAVLTTDLTLYARWTANTYTINFKANKGYGYMQTQTFTYDMPQTLSPNTFNRTGYHFIGWNTQADGMGINYKDGAEVSNLTPEANGTVNLYAQWLEYTYTVSFNANGGKGHMDDMPLTYDTPQNLIPCTFTRIGYTFVGWNTQADGMGTNYTDGQTVLNLTDQANVTVTFYAQWAVNHYEVTFNANGGNGNMDNMSFEYNMTQFLIPCTFSRTGYHFAGWNTQANGMGTSYEDGAEVSNLTAEANKTITLYAQWTGYMYTVSFNANGGKGKMDDMLFIYGTPQNLNTNTFTRTGYTFVGWNTQADGKGIKYDDAAEVISMSDIENDIVKLYAQWQANNYIVTFNANGGSGNMETQAFTYDEPQILTSNTYTKIGYIFANWNTQADGMGITYADKEEIYNLTAIANAEVTLYAQWTANTYSVIFYANGGEGTMNEQSFIYDEPQALASCTFSRTGYTFVAWNTAVDGSGDSYTNEEVISNLTIIPNGTVRLYAQWEVSFYIISINIAEGCENMGEVIITPPAEDNRYKYGTTVIFTATAYDGYKFVQWSDGDTNATRTINIAGDLTLTATFDTLNQSSLPTPEAGVWKTIGADGMLSIAGTAAEAEVYDVRGALVYRGTERTLHLPAGIYIVRAEGLAQKAVVK